MKALRIALLTFFILVAVFVVYPITYRHRATTTKLPITELPITKLPITILPPSKNNNNNLQTTNSNDTTNNNNKITPLTPLAPLINCPSPLPQNSTFEVTLADGHTLTNHKIFVGPRLNPHISHFLTPNQVVYVVGDVDGGLLALIRANEGVVVVRCVGSGRLEELVGEEG